MESQQRASRQKSQIIWQAIIEITATAWQLAMPHTDVDTCSEHHESPIESEHQYSDEGQGSALIVAVLPLNTSAF
jgi:hypothetical protein